MGIYSQSNYKLIYVYQNEETRSSKLLCKGLKSGALTRDGRWNVWDMIGAQGMGEVAGIMVDVLCSFKLIGNAE
jgi:hypothetical protein